MSESCSSYQIDLAEDNPADVGLVRAALQEHEVDRVLRAIADGEEALSFIDSLDLDQKLPCPDLLILDLHHPERDRRQRTTEVPSGERTSLPNTGRDPYVLRLAIGARGRREKRRVPLSPKDHCHSGICAAKAPVIPDVIFWDRRSVRWARLEVIAWS